MISEAIAVVYAFASDSEPSKVSSATYKHLSTTLVYQSTLV